MTLYHGSNVKVEKPEIIEAKRYLDFGMGFYTTSDLEQAQKWAIRKTNKIGSGTPIVSVFEFPDSAFEKLKVLSFPTANAQWLNFVCDNRKGKIIQDEYDLIIGPVANDNTIRTINDYLIGYLPEDIAIQLLLTQKLKDQYTFKNEKTLKLLAFKEVLK